MTSKAKVKKELEYTKTNQHAWTLERPDTYLGSVVNTIENMNIAKESEEGKLKIIKEKINFNPGLLKIFIEPLSNAIDNVWRSNERDIPVSKIKVDIDKETGETTIWNDGLTIPLKIHEKEKIYIPEMVFSNFLTSSNYNDKEERKTSGRNGLGVKLTNIFSTKFTIKTSDGKQTYTQTWKDNMYTRGDPKIKNKTGKSFTEVSWIPDFKRFSLNGYTDEIIDLFRKYCIDATLFTEVSVYFNGEKMKGKNLKEYVSLFPKVNLGSNSVDDSISKKEVLFFKSKNCEVAIMPSKSFEFFSSVNGVETIKGGIHVDKWVEGIFRPIVDWFNKSKRPSVNISDIRKFFRIFVLCTIANPSFTNQAKEKMTGPDKIDINVDEKSLKSLRKWGFVQKVEDIIKTKEFTELKKGEKTKGTKKIEGYDPANKCKSKDSEKCSLIFTEGLSAKAFAVKGIEKGLFGRKGRDWFGIFPLRGKLLNVRNNIPSTIAKNKEITGMIQAIGLKHGVDYSEDISSLNYGRVIILTDSDTDGYHISGLIQNFFHYLFPSLLLREEPFISHMYTPIVRIYSSKGKTTPFYTINEFKEYYSENKDTLKNCKIKYCKGLATTKDNQEIYDSFGEKVSELIIDEKTDDAMTNVFNSKYSDFRKGWLETYDKNHLNLEPQISISDFLNTEVIKFSIDDCKRSIPCLVDGLKESHRKILYTSFLKKLNYSSDKVLRVSQLGGAVGEHTNYKHGDASLYGTIIGMAQWFTGSNNIPLLFPDGQFGFRLMGGDDAGAPRYIFTKLEMLTRLIYRVEDDPLLKQLEDEGDLIEPEFYVPIIPMILVNGVVGIGTGYSSTIPPFNPLDILDCIHLWLEDNNCNFPELTPWYSEFKGKIEKESEKKYISHGIFKEEKGKVIITEIPINTWIDPYKEFLEKLVDEKKIKKIENYSKTNEPHFILTGCEKVDEKSLKLTSSISLNNMVLFTEEGKIKKFSKVSEILKSFCEIRYKFYILRKKHQLEGLEYALTIVSNKIRFLTEIMEKKLIIEKRKGIDVAKDLEKRKYYKLSFRSERESKESGDDSDSGTNVKGVSLIREYSYLTGMKITSFTLEKLSKLEKEKDDLTQKIETLTDTSEADMWKEDLREFKTSYLDFVRIKRERNETVDKTLKKKLK